jgi:FKBP-type peptidyl-prolyl cis-trans isomerase FkpA
MKKLLFPLLFLGILLASCSDDDEDTVAEQLKIDIELIEQYLVDSNLTAQSTGSGLYYIMEEEGTGDRPDIFAYVTVSYTGLLIDGTVFEEDTIDSYPLYNLIEGWQEGMQLFNQGGKGSLFIPSKFGYGGAISVDEEGDTIITANSILIFNFSLDSVELRDDL